MAEILGEKSSFSSASTEQRKSALSAILENGGGPVESNKDQTN